MELKTSYASDNYPIIVEHHAINSLEIYIKMKNNDFSLSISKSIIYL